MKRTKSIAPGTGKAARKNFPGPHPNSRQLHTTRVCRSCGQKFSAATSTSEYCSRKCYQHDYYQRNKPQILDKRNKRERAEEPAIPPVDSDMISVRETARRLVYAVKRSTISRLKALSPSTTLPDVFRMSVGARPVPLSPRARLRPYSRNRVVQRGRNIPNNLPKPLPKPPFLLHPQPLNGLRPKSYAHVITGIRPICTDSYSAIGFRASKTAVTRCTPFLR